RELLARGWIYKGSHSGWYSVSDEAFYAPNQVIEVEVDGEMVKVAKESGSRVEWMEEENYKFRLSAFREKLTEWLESNPRSIVPLDRWKEVHTLVADHEINNKREKVYTHPLEDLSISRPSSRLSWGIPVPDDPEHTIYVWIDALTNYITALGYPWSGSGGKQAAWPADVQVIGVDIVRFHAIYWPAMLFALGLEPPKTLLTHGHWTMDNFKMSKSRGNVADPFKAIETYGADAVRYYLMRNAPLVTKSDWSDAQVKKHYQRDLASMIGNLCNRINSEKLVAKLPETYRYRLSGSTLTLDNMGEVQSNEVNAPVQEMLFETLSQFESKMDTLEVNKAVTLVSELVERANAFFTHAAPWSEPDPVRVAEAHLYAHQALHLSGILLNPVMPTKSSDLLDRLGIQPDQRTWTYAQQTFGSERSNGRVLETPRLTLGPYYFPVHMTSLTNDSATYIALVAAQASESVAFERWTQYPPRTAAAGERRVLLRTSGGAVRLPGSVNSRLPDQLLTLRIDREREEVRELKEA
ncbi:methionyl-tRNA synthetase, partial [Tulasnella sp. 408]